MKNMFATLLLAVLVTLGSVECQAAAKADKKAVVSVMSYNIRTGTADDGPNSWEHRKELSLEMIRFVAPDLIGMQEVQPMQADYLTENLTEYGKVGIGRDDGQRKGEQMAVFYRKERFELLDSGHFWLSATPDEVSRGWDGACNRMCTWVKLHDRTSGRDLFLFDTHLDHKGKQARLEGAKLLAERIQKIAGRNVAFLTGDFNAPATAAVLEPLFEAFSSARDKARMTDHLATYNGWGKAKPGGSAIDHIFYQRATPLFFKTITREFSGRAYVSDHYPIVATFQLK